MGIETRALTQNEMLQAQQQTDAIGSVGQSAITAGQLVFFAAFDGTNNQRNNLALSGDPQMTNVAQLEIQVATQNLGNDNIRTGYYPGPGTDGTLFASSWYPPQVTQQVINTAHQAYDDFGRQAGDWLAANPGGSVTAAMTAFSRGNASMVIFAQLLSEKGLIDPRNGAVLIPPGQVPIAAMAFVEPVYSGVTVDMSIPSNVNPNNILEIGALDEFRTLFKLGDYGLDPRVQLRPLFGNHCDIGGCYNDQGLGALGLEGLTQFFRNVNLPIGDVPVDRQFNANGLAPIHTEAQGFRTRNA